MDIDTINTKTLATMKTVGLDCEVEVVEAPLWTGWHFTMDDMVCFPSVTKRADRINQGDIDVVVAKSKEAFDALVGSRG